MKQIALKGRTYPTYLNHLGTVIGGWIMVKLRNRHQFREDIWKYEQNYYHYLCNFKDLI